MRILEGEKKEVSALFTIKVIFWQHVDRSCCNSSFEVIDSGNEKRRREREREKGFVEQIPVRPSSTWQTRCSVVLGESK